MHCYNGFYFTRYAQAYATHNKSGKTVAATFSNDFVLIFRFADKLHRDQGLEFQTARKVVRHQSLKDHFINYHPEDNGWMERFNWTLLSMFRVLPETQTSSWKDLQKMVHSCNCTRHESTGTWSLSLIYSAGILGFQSAWPLMLTIHRLHMLAMRSMWANSLQRWSTPAESPARRVNQTSIKGNEFMIDRYTVQLKLTQFCLAPSRLQCWEFLVKFSLCLWLSQHHLTRWNEAILMEREEGEERAIFPFSVFCTVSRESFTVLFQSLLVRIVGDRVLVRNLRKQLRHGKLKGYWKDICTAVSRKGTDSPLYTLKPKTVRESNQTLHWNVLLPCTSLRFDHRPQEHLWLNCLGIKKNHLPQNNLFQWIIRMKIRRMIWKLNIPVFQQNLGPPSPGTVTLMKSEVSILPDVT